MHNTDSLEMNELLSDPSFILQDDVYVHPRCKYRSNSYYQRQYTTKGYIINICKKLATMGLSVSRHSTVHSLSHLSQARNNKQQLLWLLIGFGALIGFIINLYHLIGKFIEYPVLTNIYHDLNGFEYPDVTICNTNPLYFGSQKTNSSLNEILTKFKSNIIKELDSSQLNNLNYDASDMLFVQNKVNYSHPAWSLIVKCIYMQSECSWWQFEQRHIWPYGNCFTFNVSKMARRTRNVSKSMIKNGWRPDFKMVLYKGLGYLHSFGRDPFNNINTPTGVLMMIHEMDTFPIRDEGIFVDSYTQIDLKITTKVHLNVHNKCDVVKPIYEYYDFKTNKCSNFIGRQFDCLVKLVQKEMAKNCGCVLHTIPVPCELKSNLFCVLTPNLNLTNQCLQRRLVGLSKHHKHHECHRDFCKHTSFSTIVSHSSYPAIRERQNHQLWLNELLNLQQRELKYSNSSDLHNHAIKDSILAQYNIHSIEDAIKLSKSIPANKIIDETFINQNFMLVRVVPSSLFMDHVEETREYPLSRLLSDVGGCVGLWVGASLITFFELFDLCLRGLDVILHYRAAPHDDTLHTPSRTHLPTNSKINNIDGCTVHINRHDSVHSLSNDICSSDLHGNIYSEDWANIERRSSKMNYESESNSIISGLSKLQNQIISQIRSENL